MLGHCFEWLVVSVVDLLDFDRGEVIERAVEAVGVEPGHPFGGGCFDVSDVSPGALVVDELGLVEPDLRLGEGVIVSVADAANGRVDVLVGEAFGDAIDV